MESSSKVFLGVDMKQISLLFLIFSSFQSHNLGNVKRVNVDYEKVFKLFGGF